MINLGHLTMDAESGLGLRDRAVVGGELEDHHAAQMGDLAPRESQPLDVPGTAPGVRRLRPAQLVDEEPLKIERLQDLAGTLGVELGQRVTSQRMDGARANR